MIEFNYSPPRWVELPAQRGDPRPPDFPWPVIAAQITHRFALQVTLLDFSIDRNTILHLKSCEGDASAPPRRHHHRLTLLWTITLGLAVFVLCPELQPVPETPRTMASLSFHFNRPCHQMRLPPTAPPSTPGFACFCVHASTCRPHKNTLIACIFGHSEVFWILLSPILAASYCTTLLEQTQSCRC